MTVSNPSLFTSPVQPEFFSLPQAAKQLGWPIGILIRLCTVFRRPGCYFQQDNCLPSWPDLLLAPEDLQFFKWVADQLATGRSLAQLKTDLRGKTNSLVRLSSSTALQRSTQGAYQRRAQWKRQHGPVLAQQQFDLYKEHSRLGKESSFIRLLQYWGRPSRHADKTTGSFPVFRAKGSAQALWQQKTLHISTGFSQVPKRRSP